MNRLLNALIKILAVLGLCLITAAVITSPRWIIHPDRTAVPVPAPEQPEGPTADAAIACSNTYPDPNAVSHAGADPRTDP